MADTTKAEQRFSALQLAAQAAQDAYETYKITLYVRYGDHGYASRTEDRRKDQLDRAAQRTWKRFYRFLESLHSPRDWSQRVPCSWILRSATYQDIITADALLRVPPPSYGYTEQDMRQFAAAVPS